MNYRKLTLYVVASASIFGLVLIAPLLNYSKSEPSSKQRQKERNEDVILVVLKHSQSEICDVLMKDLKKTKSVAALLHEYLQTLPLQSCSTDLGDIMICVDEESWYAWASVKDRNCLASPA